MSAERVVNLFRNGRNQAVQIPCEFELPASEAIMRKEGSRLVIDRRRKNRRWNSSRRWSRSRSRSRQTGSRSSTADPRCPSAGSPASRASSPPRPRRRCAGRRCRPVVFGRGANEIAWTPVDEVAAQGVRAVLDPELRGQTIDVAGSDPRTLEQLARGVMQDHGWQGEPRHVPRAALHLMALVPGQAWFVIS